MPTDVVMPQMGESVAEGTIVRWMKKVGDQVDRDEPLFEISTDKVDAEIPAPAAGVVTEIRHGEGETVPVNTVVAVIGPAGESAAASSAAPRENGTPQVPTAPVPPPPPAPQADGAPATAERAAPARVEQQPRPAPAPQQSAGATARPSPGPPGAQHHLQPPSDGAPPRSSPLVRRIAKEHNVDISGIRGTGTGGRVTKHDILAFIEDKGGRAAQAGRVGQTVLPPVTKPPPQSQRGASDHIEKMTPMRKRIAEHMITSRRTSAHVHSVFEVNFSRVARIRALKKDEYEAAGARLTYLSFILRAVVEALRAVPVVNASVDGENIVYHREINIGVAVALDWGLIVPVIKNADEKSLFEISRVVAELANRARAKQLKPDEVSGGTFTVTNPGVFGALFGMPIINQPQAAILGVGNIEKRPIVIDDAIAIRPMGYLTLGYDHRLIDGAVADEFMSHLKHTLENWDPEQS